MDRPYKCNFCTKNFKYNSNLNQHIAQKHLNPQSWNCHKCNKSFAAKTSMQRHIKNKTCCK